MKLNRVYFFLIFIFPVLSYYSCKNTANKSKNKQAVESSIIFIDTIYDFGNISYDSNGRCYFEFTNDSEQDLIVNTVRASCGCTRPEWPKEPVKPGESGRIGVSYNTRITGSFQKTITVYSNAGNSPVKLYIKGNVEKENKE